MKRDQSAVRSPWSGAASAAPKLPTLLFSAGLLLSLSSAARALSCATHKVVLQAGGGDCTTIGACLPSGTLTGDYCVDIQDNATYAEQVTVQNVATAGFQIVIGTTTGAFRPTIAPPASSTAAFVIANASVSVVGVDAAPASAVTYGVYVSSPYVTISSVNVLDAGGKISAAGVAASSWTTVSNSSVTVGGATATGIWLPGSVMASVSYSSAQASASNAYALRLTGASSNTISGVYLQNLPGYGAYLLNANGNVVSGSSVACDNQTGNAAALYFRSSSSNTVSATYLRNSYAEGIELTLNSNYNSINRSTAVLTAAGGQSAIRFDTSFYNSVADSFFTASGGEGVGLYGASFNSISRSTMSITNGMGSVALDFFSSADSNTVNQCYIANPDDTAVRYVNGAAYNVVAQSTIYGGPSTNWDPSGVFFQNGTDNTVSQCTVSNPGGYGADFGSWSVRNVITQSTVTSAAAGYSAVYFATGASSNTVSSSYIQGSTAVYLDNAQSTVIDSSVLIATNSTGKALWAMGGSSNLALTNSALTGGPLGAGLFLDSGNTGPIALSSDVFRGSLYGVLIAAQGAGAAVTASGLTFSSLSAGATAVNFTGGVFVSTFASASFDSSIAINVNAVSLAAGSRLTMTAWSGAAGGPAYEHDPSGYVDWASTAVAAPSYAGCAVTENVGSGQTYATIQSAVNALPSTLTGPSCVVIRDGATYAEQVTVRNFTMNGSSIAIFADPASGLAPVVSPPAGSTAAFVIANASVSVAGVNIVPAGAIAYGVAASSAYVSIENVNVLDAGGLIGSAGIVVSSWTTVSDSSVTVGGSGATGILLQRASRSSIARSSATTPNAAGGYALWFSTASSNTVTQSVFVNGAGTAVYASSGSSLNSIILSSLSTAKDGALALHLRAFASSNTVSQTFMSNAGALEGQGVRIEGDYNTVSRSSAVSAAADSYAVGLFGSFNVLSEDYFYSPGYGAGEISGPRHTIASSTFVGGNLGAYFLAASSATVTQSVFISTYATGLWLVSSHSDSISLSTMSANNIGGFGLFLSGADNETITQCSIANRSGRGVSIQSSSDWNTISGSTITGAFGFSEGVNVYRSSANVLSGDVIRGPVAVHVDGSTGTAIDSSVLVATAATGTALLADHGAVGFTLSNSYLATPSSATGISLAVGNSGVFAVAGATVAGAKYGLSVATQTAGTALAISGLNFSGLTSGATAIHFTGGTFVSTFSGVSFDSSVAVNVEAAALSPGSDITMSSLSGVKSGPTYENDPSDYVHWPAGPALAGCALIRNVGAGQPYATIQSAVNALPATLTGPACVVIRDGATYAEQVTVQNFAVNGSSISILADPASGLTPVVSPPAGSTAAFSIANASVSLSGINVVPTSVVKYGILVSSSYVAVSSVNVQDAGGRITSAGVAASSWTSVSYTSVTVNGSSVKGIYINGSFSTLSRSSAAANGTSGFALLVTGSTNTISDFSASNIAGNAVYISGNSNYNAVNRSVAVGSAGNSGLVLGGGSYNTIMRTSLSAPGGYGAYLSNCAFNTISLSTMVGDSSVYAGLYMSGSDNNVVTQSVIQNASGTGARLTATTSSTISSSTIASGGAGTSALYIDNNTMANSGNRITQSVISSPNGIGAFITSTRGNLISQSTITSSSSGSPALWIYSISINNLVTQSYISNPQGTAALLTHNAELNSISFSTLTTNASGYFPLDVVSAASNTFTGDYLHGPNAARISGAANTMISGSVFEATDAAGVGLDLLSSSEFTLLNSTLSALATGTGLWLDTANGANLFLATNTVLGARYGMLISSQSPVATLSIQTMKFSGLAPGATAINFLAGSLISTFSAVAFDSSVAVNVSAVSLSTDSRITMNGRYGPRTGQAYENDPNSLVDWLGPLPAAPTVAGAPLGVSSISWTWTATANADSYNVYRATDGALLGNVASPSYVVTGLSTNTAFGISVAGTNGSGYGAASGATVYTLAEPPGTISFGAVSSATVALAWSSGTNPAGTLYEVSASTGAGYAVISTTTLSTSTAAGLAPSTAYSFRVRALNGDMIGSAYASTATTTLPPVPGGAGIPSGTALGVSSISWSWAAAANAASYNVYAAASGALLGNVATASYLQTGLSTNAASGLRVAGVDASGLGALSGSATAYTLAEAPGAPAVGAVSSATVALDWTSGANPAGTLYELSLSTGAGFATVSTTTLTTSTATGLSPSTAYVFRLRAFNGDMIGSAYVSTAASTLPPLPGAPGTPVGTAVGVSSVSWTWTAAANAASYALFESSAPVVALGTTAGLTLTQTGLSPNTTASVFVQASNASGAGVPSSSAAAVYTLANPPAGLAALSIQITSATLGWSLNGNPSGTTAELERSTDSAAFRNVFAGAAVSAADSGLAACTTYSYRVRDRNGGSVATAYSGTVSFTTLASTPLAPSSLTAEAMAGSRILLTWGPSASEGVTGYRLYEVGSGTGSYGAAVAVFASTETSYLTAALPPGFHGFALRAFNRCGVEEPSGTYASVSATVAVSDVRAAIKVPNTGKRIRGNSVTIVAELLAGLPADASFVTFQIKPAAGGSWTDVPASNVNHPNPVLSSPYFIQWDADAYASANGDGWYDLRAVATNVAGSSDTAPSSIRVELVDKNVATRPGDDYDIKEDAGSKDEVINSAVPVTLGSGGLGAEAPAVTILLPAGAVSASTATATVVANPAISTAPPAGMTLVGSSLQVDLSNLQSVLNSPAVLTLTYPPSADAYAEMRIESLDPLTGVWSPIGASTRDRNLRTVTAATPHFSVFAIVAGSPAAIGLSGVRAYPVPYKPNGVNPNEGKPYSAGDATSGIVFDRLPPGAVVKIYTLEGRLTAELSAAAGGAIHWDARNGSGRDAASGGYFAVVTAPGSKSVVKRLLIVR